MMSYKLGILDEDTGYVIKLMEYINMQKNCIFKASAFSSEKSIKEYMEHNKLDIILTDCEIQIAPDVAEVVSFTDVIKYQNVDNIIARLETIVENRNEKKSEPCKLYAVYSPYGRCGKTNLSLGICSVVKNSLYIGMEEYSGISCNDMIRSAGDKFLYFMVSRNDDLFEYVYSENERNKNQYGDFHIIPGGLNYMDIRQISIDDLRWFREKLYAEPRYSSAVLDVGTGAMGNINVLQVADKIVVPLPDGLGCDVKMECFRQTLKRDNLREVEEKIICINMPDVPYTSDKVRTLIEGSVL